MGKSSQAPATTTTTTQPWRDQRPFLRDMFGQAQSLHNSGAGAIVPFGQDTQSAFGMTRDLAGQNVWGGATQQLADTASGAYMGGNPWLDAAYGQAADRVGTSYRDAVSGTTGNFSAGGRLGSGAYANARNNLDTQLGDTLGNLATGIYGGAYESERDRMLKAQALAPQMDALRYSGADRLGAIGATQEQLAQLQSDLPWTNLGRYASVVGSGNWGGTQQTSRPQTSSPLGGALGGALTGLAIPGLGWGGALIGGGLGLLGSL